MVYVEKYREFLEEAERGLSESKKATHDGDLWVAKLNLDIAIDNLTKASELLVEVSRIAFERVFK